MRIAHNIKRFTDVLFTLVTYFVIEMWPIKVEPEESWMELHKMITIIVEFILKEKRKEERKKERRNKETKKERKN